MEFSSDNFLGLTLSGAIGAIIEESNSAHPFNCSHGVVLFEVGVPCLNDAGVDGAEVGLAESMKVGIVASQNLHHTAPGIAVGMEWNDF